MYYYFLYLLLFPDARLLQYVVLCIKIGDLYLLDIVGI